MTSATALDAKASATFWRAIEFITQQYDPRVRGWGAEPGTSPDSWTTAQLVGLLNTLKGIHSDVVEGGTTFLLDGQNLDGSWGSTTSSGGDVPASAHATISLLNIFGSRNLPVQRGLGWLVKTYRRGWTTAPHDIQGKFSGTHFYSTSMALRALCKASPLEIRSMCVQDAISLLLIAQNNGQGWGFGSGRYSDATFTSYVLHGLVDAALNNSAISDTSISSATKWLRSVQAPEGWWADWHRVQRSPEATGYATYSLIRSYDHRSGHAYANADKAIIKAVEWLIAQQQDDGGWLFDPAVGAVSNNWVTFSVALGIRAFLAAREENSKYRFQRGECTIFDVDAVPLDRPVKSGRPRGASRPHALYQYQTSFPDQLRDLPSVRELDHTMFDAIDIYVKQKVPHEAIYEIMNAEGKIELHQVYPTDFLQIAAERKWTIRSEIETNIKPRQQILNAIRPRFFLGQNEEQKERLWIAVTPGRDYFYHYSLMIRHVVSMRTVDPARYILMYRYPIAEREIVDWTGLRRVGLANEDIVLIGYVSEIEKHLSKLEVLRLISSTDTEYYVCNKFSAGSRHLTTLGVKFSFWGSIAGLIAQTICAMNCRELIYIGKLGALTSPADIYDRVFSPSRFVQLRHAQIDFEEPAPPNHILDRFKHLNSGVHVSVPTVLEEDYVQRGKASELHAKSIDNEMASIVSAISAWNRERSRKTAFTSLHFATDYIRRPNERALAVDFDLGRDKTSEARRRKELVLKRITSEILVPYLRVPLPRDSTERR